MFQQLEQVFCPWPEPEVVAQPQFDPEIVEKVERDLNDGHPNSRHIWIVAFERFASTVKPNGTLLMYKLLFMSYLLWATIITKF